MTNLLTQVIKDLIVSTRCIHELTLLLWSLAFCLIALTAAYTVPFVLPRILERPKQWQRNRQPAQTAQLPSCNQLQWVERRRHVVSSGGLVDPS